MLNSIVTFFRRYLLRLATIILVGFALVEIALQLRDDAEIRRTSTSIILGAGAKTTHEKVISLRNFIRQTVTFENAPHDDRPFFRATARETLINHSGYCGEVTRLFICLARAEDIPAQRINLYGRHNHVVAVVDLSDGINTLVDCQQPPTIADLEPLDSVLNRPEFDDYSTLNLRRIGFSRFVTRLKIDIGWLTYLTENPHALKAVICLLILAVLWSAIGCRILLRRFLLWRGWVHKSSLT
jgi:hypothetical protein